jgi:uncharacterized repeat protein (TIGR03803 family)
MSRLGFTKLAAYGPAAIGLIFGISRRSRKTTVYNFAAGTDGAYPEGTLGVNGTTLYGTTLFGGGSNYGIVYSVSTGGSESVLHRFAGSDGAYPQSSVIYNGGKLYGTALSGGAKSDGVAFSLTL